MKIILIVIPFFSLILNAQTPATPAVVEKPVAEKPQAPLTVSQAKESCKVAGKEGKDLLLCIKEKMGTPLK